MLSILRNGEHFCFSAQILASTGFSGASSPSEMPALLLHNTYYVVDEKREQIIHQSAVQQAIGALTQLGQRPVAFNYGFADICAV